MTPGELRASASLAGIFSLRMLGLFMILPVFALYAEHLRGSTPLLTGLAIGAYGITQALLQIPYGLLSDRFGRKRLITIGLIIFALGSVVAALADSIYGVIAGRALQGAGAIAAVVLALAADLTREEHRTKAMAVIGMSIGLSFSLAMVIGPVLDQWVGVSGIFWLTAVLALAGIGVLFALVPSPALSRPHRDAEPVPAQFGRVLRDGQLLRLDLGILVLHMILTASFVALPLALRDYGGLPGGEHWKVYLGVLPVSVALMVPFIVLAERRRRMKPVFLGAIVLLAVSQAGMAWLHRSLFGIVAMLLVFYTAFNLLEATLPSLISKTAPPESKGTAMGFYSSAQFLGAFLGGAVGGWLMGEHYMSGVFLFTAGAAAVWFLVAAGMRNPRYLTSYLLHVDVADDDHARRLARELTRVRGVAEAVVIAADGVAYLKVDAHALDEAALGAYAGVAPAD